MKGIASLFYAIVPFCLVISIGLGGRAQAQDTQQIINQTTAAHGGRALTQVYNSVATGVLTDSRMTPSLPVAATLKSFGKATRIEYANGAGSVALVRNGARLWEIRTTQAKEYRKQHVSLQDVFFNPSLGLVGGLSVPEFSYLRTTTLRGRPVYVLRKSHWTQPFGSSNYTGRPEYVYVYVDTGTFLINQVDYTFGGDYNYWSFRYNSYSVVAGVAVPMSVSHWVNNTLIWQIQMQTMAFNLSVNPRDFISP